MDTTNFVKTVFFHGWLFVEFFDANGVKWAQAQYASNQPTEMYADILAWNRDSSLPTRMYSKRFNHFVKK